jgi:hypothetical protein
MIDQMAERYGILPSVLLRDATTIDLFVFDTAVSYANLQQRRSAGEKEEISQDVLLQKLEKFNANKNKGNK